MNSNDGTDANGAVPRAPVVTCTDRTQAMLSTDHPAGLIIDGKLIALVETPELAEMLVAALSAKSAPGLSIWVFPAEDLPGQWVASWVNRVGYFLESQGNSKTHALRMLAEAIEMVEGEDALRCLPCRLGEPRLCESRECATYKARPNRPRGLAFGHRCTAACPTHDQPCVKMFDHRHDEASEPPEAQYCVFRCGCRTNNAEMPKGVR